MLMYTLHLFSLLPLPSWRERGDKQEHGGTSGLFELGRGNLAAM